MTDEEKLKELKRQLEEKKKSIPGHCSETEFFVEHNSPLELELFQQIDELESEIKNLEEKLKKGGLK